MDHNEKIAYVKEHLEEISREVEGEVNKKVRSSSLDAIVAAEDRLNDAIKEPEIRETLKDLENLTCDRSASFLIYGFVHGWEFCEKMSEKS